MQKTAEQDSPLLQLLSLLSPESSKNTLRGWVEKRRVLVENHLITRHDHIVSKGEKVTVLPKSKFLSQDIQVLFEDKDIIVINKPEGLLSVATDFEKSLTAHCIIKRSTNHKIVYPVHRLDRETSGVMVFAFSEKTKDRLKDMFYHHDIQRQYIAIIEGKIPEAKGTWKSYLQEDILYHVKSVDTTEGSKLAITHFETLQTSSKNSFLRLTLETGRKNQIRVHCKEAGFPIIGDKKYGGVTDPIHRLGLHAERLEFVHPISGKKLVFSTPIPKSFSEFLARSFPKKPSS